MKGWMKTGAIVLSFRTQHGYELHVTGRELIYVSEFGNVVKMVVKILLDLTLH